MNQTGGTVLVQQRRSLVEVGELWALVGVLGYASANVFEAHAVKGADPLIGPLIRGIPSLVLAIVLMYRRNTFGQLQPHSPHYIGRKGIILFIVPGVLATLGLFTYFYALQLGGVAITIPVQQSFILWGALASWLYLGERFGAKSLLGVALVVTGLVVLGLGRLTGTPVTGQWYYAIPLALFTAIAFGVSGVFWRLGQLHGADQSTGILVNTLASEVVALIGLMLAGRLSALWETSVQNWLALLAGGALSGIVGLYGMFTSLKYLSVTRAYALSSLTPLVAATLAFLFLGEQLNVQMVIGIIMVTVGVALVQIFKPTEKATA